MKVHIFDVEQGECNIVQTPAGHTILIGAGHNSSTNWRPSSWFKKNNLTLSNVVLTNFDEDHLSDLPNFEPNIRPLYLTYNFNINPDWVYQDKQQTGLGNGVATGLHWVKNVFTGDRVNVDYGIEKKHFYHHPSKFQDSNNLSMITFIYFSGVGFLFPSDVEKAGLEEFLLDQSFVDCLQRTNVLLAPHHGRKDDYSMKIFKYCRPDVVVISDKDIQYDTQDHNLYAQHANGLTFNDGDIRKVLTTRNDGKITFEVTGLSQYSIRTKDSY